MKVLFIQPPIEDFYDTSIRTYPLGLLYVGAKAADVADVALLDARTGRRQILKGHGFHELDDFYRTDVVTPFSFFGRYSRYGMSRDEIARAITSAAPDIIGVSSMCSAYEQQAMEVAETAKRIDEGTITVFGGIHPTLFPERILSNPHIDYCIRGEGETPFLRLVSALVSGAGRGGLRGIDGLCFREEGRLHITEPATEGDIDLLPNRRLVRADSYRIGKRPYTFFLTSRGCPNSCGFCGKPPFPYRRRALASIAREVEECVGLGIESLDFEDDMLNLDRESFSSVLRLLTGRGLTLSAMNGIYPANMDISTLNAMHDAGFRRLNFSLVDLSPRILDRQNRRQQRSFIDLLPSIEDSPFLTEVHFIIGLPGQSPRDVVETLLFLMGRRLLLGPSMFYLAPGSPIHKSLSPQTPDDGDYRLMRSSVMMPVNPLFPRQVTFALVKLVRFINYVKALIDRHDGITRLSDLLDNPVILPDERDRTILGRLLHEKRLSWYDANNQAIADEPVDQALIASFFEGAGGMVIRGYKTNRSVWVDV